MSGVCRDTIPLAGKAAYTLGLRGGDSRYKY